MAEPQPNPLLTTVLGAIQDRGAAETAKLTLLAEIKDLLHAIEHKLEEHIEQTDELIERLKK